MEIRKGFFSDKSDSVGLMSCNAPVALQRDIYISISYGTPPYVHSEPENNYNVGFGGLGVEELT